MGTGRMGAGIGAIHWHRIARAADYHVEQAAQLLQVSTRQLYRMFVAEMNGPPKRWFKQQQLDFGRHVLNRTGSVKIAAHECGYTQVANFCRDFKRMYGTSAGGFLESWTAVRPSDRHPVVWWVEQPRPLPITPASGK